MGGFDASLPFAFPFRGGGFGLRPCNPGSRRRTPPFTAQVDALFSAWNKPTSPGCAVAVMQGGRIVYDHGYGMADLDHDIPITPDTVFHVASVSKQFTAASVAMLAAEGKFSLDDPARIYVPELPDFGTPITIRQLANHTSGLRDQWNLLQLAGWRYSLDLITDGDVMRVLARQKGLNYPPGSEFLYSNTGFTVLAQVVKHVSGQSIRQFTTMRIFQPLGMTHTHFRDDHAEIVKNMAYGYVPKGETFALANTQFDTTGATSLLTTVRDLAKWDENFYTARVASPAILHKMQQSGVLTTGAKTGYGMGLYVGDYRGLPFVYHGGSDAGYRADIIRFPNQHFSVIALCNLSTSSPNQLTRGIADIYLASDLKLADKPAKAVSLKPADLAPRVGLYLNPRQDQVVRVALSGGKLMATFSSMPEAESFEMMPLDKFRFRIAHQGEVFAFAGKDGDIDGIFDDTNAAHQRLHRISTAPDYGLGGGALSDFAGTYHSAEIDATYTVGIEGDHLMISTLKRQPTRLWATSADLFDSDFAKVHFTRDVSGKITGLMFNTGRIRAFPVAKVD